MAYNIASDYKLIVPWTVNGVVVGTPGEQHPFTVWCSILGMTAEALGSKINYYDGSSPQRPKWFDEQPATPSGGDVVGLASSIDNRVALFNGTTGKLLKMGGTLGNASDKNVGTTAGTVAAGDDPRFASLPIPQAPYLQPFATKTGPGVYNLKEVYGLSEYNGLFNLSQLYSLAQAQAKFPRLFSWFNAAGKSNTWVMSMNHGPACHNEALIQGHTQSNNGSGRIDSRNIINWPNGVFLINYPCLHDGGQYRGVSCQGYYATGMPATVLRRDKTNWIGHAKRRLLFEPSTFYASDIWTAYQETVVFEDFRLEGDNFGIAHDYSTMEAGLCLFRSGEACWVNRIFASGFNGYGIISIGATPLTVGTVSCFSSTYGGFGIIGSDLSTQHIGLLSGDDNPALLRVGSYGAYTDEIGNSVDYGVPSELTAQGISSLRAGGTIHIGAIKHETGKRDPMRGQMVCIADGNTGTGGAEGAYLDLVIGAVSMDVEAFLMDAAFGVMGFDESATTRATASDNRKARISVGGFRARGYKSVLHDYNYRKVYLSPADYVQFGFTWNARSGPNPMWVNPADLISPLSTASVNAPRRLGLINAPSGPVDHGYPSAFDRTAGTPSYNESTVVNASVAPVSSSGMSFAAVSPSIVNVGDTAQAVCKVIDWDWRDMSATPTWYIESGPATINASTGLVTTTGAGVVVIKCVAASSQNYAWLKVQ